MGCTGSKLDDLQAVALCRDRSHLLADAIRLRYALAGAHVSYLHSLRAVSHSLHDFLNGHDPLPLLSLPTQRKGDPLPPPPISAVHHSPSHSESHIHFHSDSESDSDSDGSSPLHLHPDPTEIHFNYARSHPAAPSVSYEQHPGNLDTVRFAGEPDYPYYGYSHPTQNPNSYPLDYSSFAGIGDYYGSSFPPAAVPPSPPNAKAGNSHSSRAPPPPPSPPRTSTWDFLNPFQTFEREYPPYTPSRNSKEVREEEGIPDLEDEDHEVVKEAYGEQNFVGSASASATGEYSSKAARDANEDEVSSIGEASKEYDAHVVDKNVVTDDVKRSEEEQRNVASFTANRSRDISEVAVEIKAQFDQVCDAAAEVSKMLEVGRIPYQQKNAVHEASSRMMSSMALPSTSKSGELLAFEEDMGLDFGNLSSTLHKLYIWENKLYEEVRAEEKMRVLYDRNCKRLKHLDERGAEAHKLDSTRTLVRKLSTKIRIAIQVVDSISNRINKLRDEELWPQINELLQRLVRMWKVMLECHRSQCQAISEADILDSIASGGKLSDAHMEAAMQLAMDLLKWITSFSAWIDAQKSYVKALNGWLSKCLLYEPEETPDGPAPHSPGRLGAPPVFVVCNLWSEVMVDIPERDVVDAMQAFAINLQHLCEQQNVELRQRIVADRDMDIKLKTLEKNEQTMHESVDALNKKLILVSGYNDLPLSGHVVYQGHAAGVDSMQLSLRKVFETMESFTAKAYEKLHRCSAEENVARENAKVE